MFTGLRLFSTARVAWQHQAASPSRQTFKKLDTRKTYLMDVYKYFWETNSIVLFAHHNNLESKENEKIRRELHKVSKDIQYRKVKTSVFRHFLRASEQPDPASKAAHKYVKRHKVRHPLEPLLGGPTALILVKDLDPHAVKGIWKVLGTKKERLFLMGGKIGQNYYDLSQIKDFKEMASLPELRAQLVGLLTQASGGGLVKTLEAASSNLVMTMEARKNQLEEASGTKPEN